MRRAILVAAFFLVACGDAGAAGEAGNAQSTATAEQKIAPYDADCERFSPRYFRCLQEGEEEGGDSLGPCAADEHDVQDARLNEVYQKALSALNAEDRDQLRRSQRLWLARRDIDCALIPAEIAPKLFSCLLYETADRADFIAQIADGP